MTTPGGQFPDDTLGDDLSSLQGITQENWEMGVRQKAIAPYNNGHNNLLGALGNVVQQIGDAITGIFPETPSDALVAIRDAQRDLSEAINYLQDVSGYANMVM